MTTIATHNGQFHADEVTAIALLKIFTEAEEVELFRTRDEDTINQCDVVVDVGGTYSPEHKRFDHHQFDRDNELYGKSSAGLVWDYIRNTVDLAIPYTAIDFLVKDVDDQDTGIKLQGHYHFCNIVGSFNTEEVYSEAQDLAFVDAVKFVEDYLHRIMNKAHVSYQQSEMARSIPVKDIAGMKVACIPSDAEYIAKHHFIGLADILLSWDEGQSAWTVLMVPIEKDSFDSKYTLLPANDAQEVFTHKAGFIGKYYEKKDGTIYVMIQTENGPEAFSLEVQ